MTTLLLWALALLYIVLFVLAWRKVRGSKDAFEFIYLPAALIGAFVWEDLLVFSAAFFIGTVLTLLVHDIRVGLLLLAAFWAVRSAGEALYFFLQQFHVPTHSPHAISHHFVLFRRLFGNVHDQKCFIFMQITWQVVLTAAIAALVLISLHWTTLPVWLS